ncbi:Protein artemis [Branchiostoma belcheri]|nr:Protein artemis [Branchiostoma belcheri]
MLLAVMMPLRPLTEHSLLVTLLQAGHCPGSVMFLFEGTEGTVLYTGDFRLPVGSAAQFLHLHQGGRPKDIQSLYVDTTFLVPEAKYIPSREDCCTALINLVQSWISRGSHYVVRLNCKAKYGYEYLFIELCRTFHMKVHVNDPSIYQEVPEIFQCLTSDPSQTQIHACRWLERYQKGRHHPLPCKYRPPPPHELEVMSVTPSTMWFTAYAGPGDVVRLRDLTRSVQADSSLVSYKPLGSLRLQRAAIKRKKQEVFHDDDENLFSDDEDKPLLQKRKIFVSANPQIPAHPTSSTVNTDPLSVTKDKTTTPNQKDLAVFVTAESDRKGEENFGIQGMKVDGVESKGGLVVVKNSFERWEESGLNDDKDEEEYGPKTGSQPSYVKHEDRHEGRSLSQQSVESTPSVILCSNSSHDTDKREIPLSQGSSRSVISCPLTPTLSDSQGSSDFDIDSTPGTEKPRASELVTLHRQLAEGKENIVFALFRLFQTHKVNDLDQTSVTMFRLFQTHKVNDQDQTTVTMVQASFTCTASGGTTSVFGRDTLGGGHQQAGIKEAIYIRALQPSLNRDGGRHRLSATYDPRSHVCYLRGVTEGGGLLIP